MTLIDLVLSDGAGQDAKPDGTDGSKLVNFRLKYADAEYAAGKLTRLLGPREGRL